MTSLAGHTAAGQSLGYLCQVDHALLQLARGTSGGVVGIETLDDIAVVQDGKTRLIQSKATTDPSRNPISDSSRDLWKTLAIWADALKRGELNLDATSLDIVTNVTLSDCLALRLGSAQSRQQIQDVADELRAHPAAPSATIQPYVEAVRLLTDEQLRGLIGRITVFHGGDGSSFEDIHSEIVWRCHLPDGVDGTAFLQSMLGWVHQTAVSCWSQQQPTWIRQQDFNNRRQAFIESNRRRQIRALPSTSIVCPSSEVASHRSKGFVRQLEIIDCDAPVIDEAITDYIKHNRERLRLAKDGHVVEDDWKQFEELLVEHWKPIFRGQGKSTKKAEQRRMGRTVYFETQKHRERLAGEPTDEFYLTRGAYQRLAESSRVGWHPNYTSLLDGKSGS